MNLIDLGLLGLFSGSFIAGSILPFPSEALAIGFFELDYDFWTIITVATIGNFIGGLTNYWIGYKSNSEGLKKRFKLNEEKIARWEKRFNKWGVWLGLFSWVTIIGDPLIGVLGFFKVKLLPLSVMMIIGKFARYFVVLWLYEMSFG